MFCAATPLSVAMRKVTEVVGLNQLRNDLVAVEGGVGRVVGAAAVLVGEADEAGVLHAVRLVRAGRERSPAPTATESAGKLVT